MDVQAPVNSEQTSHGRHYLGFHATEIQLSKWLSHGEHKQNTKLNSKFQHFARVQRLTFMGQK